MEISRRGFHRLAALWSGGVLFQGQSGLLLSETSGPPLQPLAAQVKRLLVALQSIGSPLPAPDVNSLEDAFRSNDAEGVAAIQRVLEPHLLFETRINPEGRVSVSRGRANAELIEHGWRRFLVKVNNEAGITSPFKVRSEQAEPMGRPSSLAITGVHDFTNGAVDRVLAEDRWLALDNWTKPPLQAALSGLEIEYRILLLYSRDHGRREASLEARLGDEEQDLGFRSTIPILFECLPSQTVTLKICDENGAPTTAALLITDNLNRVYPAQNKRLPPDLWFERHIYRSNGESITLPAGEYTLEYSRGPEYLRKALPLSISTGSAPPVEVKLERWITPRQFGYYSGDTHIHAAGCSHYESPSEGVTPEVMYRQVKGEALDVGDVLTWGPGYNYQKQFFTGHVQPGPSTAGSATLRYDVEVSGFPSSHCGHLVLLGLKEQDFPGAASLDQWPSWNVPILNWAKRQGAIAGYAHSGHGLNVASTDLPNYLIPPFDSSGANEFIADVTQERLVDFISGCDTRPFAELNIWYHTLNCGFRTAFVGETDFPCLTDERVGGGRTYIQLDGPPADDRGYEQWVSGIVAANSYFGDGRSHLFRFAVDADSTSANGRERHIHSPRKLGVSASVCARLEPEISAETERIRKTSPYDRPFWHLERARVGKSRRVPVELIVNGIPVQSKEIEADGTMQEVHFEVEIRRSSWVTLRILPSSHTNPLFVLLNGAPIRASRKSAQWCRTCVDVCWEQKSKRIRPAEMADAAAAFEHARGTYDRIIPECEENS
jgi:hypothetical protein